MGGEFAVIGDTAGGGLWCWNARATVSLPESVSPVIRIVLVVQGTTCAVLITSCIRRLRPTMP